MTPVALGVLALVFAGPAPTLLARSRWPLRVPRATAVLWQALALAAVLAALGAGLATAAGLVLDRSPAPLQLAGYLAVLVLTVLVAGRLTWAALTLAVRTRRRRRRHRELVELLASPTGLPPGVRVLAEQTPVAYCLPAVGGGQVVVSAGVLDRLDATELAAVLAHERAHLRARHDLVLEAFGALHAAFPRWVRSRTALDANRVLVELLADDQARRRIGPQPLARALIRLSGAEVPDAALAAATHATVLRVRRLTDPPQPQPLLACATYVLALALVVVPTVVVVLPWLTQVLPALTGGSA